MPRELNDHEEAITTYNDTDIDSETPENKKTELQILKTYEFHLEISC